MKFPEQQGCLLLLTMSPFCALQSLRQQGDLGRGASAAPGAQQEQEKKKKQQSLELFTQAMITANQCGIPLNIYS